MKITQPTHQDHAAPLRFEQLKVIFEQLSDTHSLPMLMFYRGYEPHEIARKLNISTGAALDRLSEAQQELRQLIRKNYT